MQKAAKRASRHASAAEKAFRPEQNDMACIAMKKRRGRGQIGWMKRG